MKTKLFQHVASIITSAGLLAGLLGGLPLQAVHAAGAAQAPLQAVYDCATNTQIPQAECEALVALYNGTDGANWADNTRYSIKQPANHTSVMVT